MINKYKYEDELIDNGVEYIAGCDEVGRGPIAGPLVVSAVILPNDFRIKGIDDSKKLTEKKRIERLKAYSPSHHLSVPGLLSDMKHKTMPCP